MFPRMLSRICDQQRGVVLLVVLVALLVILIFAALAVDRSFATYRRIQAQQAADMAALSGAWVLSGYGTNSPTLTEITAAKNEAVIIAADNGYSATADPNVRVTVTTPYAGLSTYFNVHVQRLEPTFFSRVLGIESILVEATATAAFNGSTPQDISTTAFGTIQGEFNYAAYGPQNGSDRGDRIDTGVTALGAGGVPNNWFGINSKSFSYNPEPTPALSGGNVDYPFGSVYQLNIPSTFRDSTGVSQNIDFELYDPDTYSNGVNAHGAYDEMNKAPGGSNSNNEDWLYTLWKGGPPGTPNATIVAQAVYGEQLQSGSPTGTNDQPNTNDHWVTPPGFEFNAGPDIGMTGASYFLSVQTSDLSKISTGNYSVGGNGTSASHGYGTGYDENGYLFRAGPPHDADNAASILQKGSSQPLTEANASDAKTTRTDLMDPYAINPTTGQTYDAYWISTYGAIRSGITAQVCTPTSINANETSGTATVHIYFGYGAANPQAGGVTKISFYGFDEDTGCVSQEYQCWSGPNMSGSMLYDFKGTVPLPSGTGNGLWNGDTYSIAGYTPGYWTGLYTTGPSDNTTWYWNDAYNNSASRSVYLISTGSNVY